MAVRQQSLCLLLEEGESRKSRGLWTNCRMRLLFQNTVRQFHEWMDKLGKCVFSLSSRKENLSPQEQFALRAEQRLQTAPGNCTAMLSQIREELNTPTDNEQLLRLKRMSKSPHSKLGLGDLLSVRI